MLNSIDIPKTADTPKVALDPQNDYFEIAGKSLPEDVQKFYDPIKQWIEEYVKQPNASTVFEFKLEYCNSASERQIVQLIALLEKIIEMGKEVKIIWYYKNVHGLMQDSGEGIKSAVDIPFEIKRISP